VPPEIVARLALTEGARVDVEVSDDGRIVVARSRRRYSLDELLAGMTTEREHMQADGSPKGDEII
jgi:antitoxin component of MazEF toxin-antitoxin module